MFYGTKIDEKAAVTVDDVMIEGGSCAPYGSCNFERDFCTWRNLGKPVSTGLEWTRNSGGIVGATTGPKIDHTTGSADGLFSIH